MINNIENILQKHIFLLVQTIFQHPLVVDIILTVVLANAALVTITLLLDAINHHNVHLVDNVQIAIEVDITLFQKSIQTIKTNVVLTSLNDPLHLFNLLLHKI